MNELIYEKPVPLIFMFQMILPEKIYFMKTDDQECFSMVHDPNLHWS